MLQVVALLLQTVDLRAQHLELLLQKEEGPRLLDRPLVAALPASFISAAGGRSGLVYRAAGSFAGDSEKMEGGRGVLWVELVLYCRTGSG